MLIEATPLADAALPVEEVKAQLRLGSGFGTESVQDAVLIGFLRAAVTAIEGRIGKALFLRGFRYVVTAWRGSDGQALPVAPVAALTRLAVADRFGTEVEAATGSYCLAPDWAEPRVRVAGVLPAIPEGGTGIVEFEAGFGVDWTGIPSDLRQAVLMLAAHYYEFRHDIARDGDPMPFGVVSLIERYRPLRLARGALA